MCTKEMPALESRRVRTQPLTVTGASCGAWPARISRPLNSFLAMIESYSGRVALSSGPTQSTNPAHRSERLNDRPPAGTLFGRGSARCGGAADVGALLGDAGLLEAHAGEGRHTGADVVLRRQCEAQPQMRFGRAGI